MALFLLLLLISFESLKFSMGQLKTSCPLKESISPCSCSKGINSRPWITCSGLSSAEQLQKSTKFMKGYSFSSMFIENSNIGRLPSAIFTDMEIQSLKITFSNLTGLGDGINRPPFLGLENSVEDIEIKDAFVDESSPMTSFSLSHLKKLTLLEITNNFVPAIANDWFESGPYGLTQLLFVTTSTKKLGSHAFSSLINLKQITVSGGKIKDVSRYMFPKPAHHLTAIDLSNNALSYLPADIFHAMPSLTEVYLDSNSFTEINELTWSTVWNQLTHVLIYGNPIDCSENMKWIYKYRLPEVLGGSCAKPTRLKLKQLRKLTLKDFQ